ncbi:MAG: RsbRD N-terminal domain-containing protein [Deltaproteobacteria bacterium]|nr:RsbRD N-terminal domain-containing protein [Deltaproteobacteria bacterium]
MSLKQVLVEKKPSIVRKWRNLVLQTYPAESQSLFRKQDQFGNPVGYTISEGIPAIYDAVVVGEDPEEATQHLDNILRIRAVQELSPSRAVGFLFGLKELIRRELGQALYGKDFLKQWAVLEARIDTLALLGFDIYQRCRQQNYDIRGRDVNRRSERLLQMAGLAYEIPEGVGDAQEETQTNALGVVTDR